MKSLKSSLLAIAGLCLLSACDKHTAYHSFLSVPQEGWERGDTLSFKVHLQDSVPTMHYIYIGVRNTNDYSFRDLHLLVQNNFQDSTVFRTDSVTFTLADHEGRWQGKGWNNLYQSEIKIGPALVSHPANYTVRVIQDMRSNPLVGIHDIGIRIDK